MGDEEFEMDVIPSPHDPLIGAHVGVRIRHKTLHLTAESTSQKTQYANKLNAIQMVKERFPELVVAKFDGNTCK